MDHLAACWARQLAWLKSFFTRAKQVEAFDAEERQLLERIVGGTGLERAIAYLKRPPVHAVTPGGIGLDRTGLKASVDGRFNVLVAAGQLHAERQTRSTTRLRFYRGKADLAHPYKFPAEGSRRRRTRRTTGAG